MWCSISNRNVGSRCWRGRTFKENCDEEAAQQSGAGRHHVLGARASWKVVATDAMDVAQDCCLHA